MTLLIDFLVIVVLIAGIWQFREPRGARIGNMLAAFALLLAFVLILYRNGVIDIGTVAVSLAAGAISGYGLAKAVNMIQIPSMVAFQHGAGGVAAFLVSFVELTRGTHSLDLVGKISGVLGLSIGALTFSGSMIASAKLANKMRQTPQVLPVHGLLLFVGIAVLLVFGTVSFYVPEHRVSYLYIAQIVLSACFGILFSVRIGGADMPVLISFLNATAGLAAAFCGMVIENRLLIAFGATVAASGSILTHVMCKAMNRNIVKVFFPPIAKRKMAPGKDAAKAASAGAVEVSHENETETADGISTAADLIIKARKVIIIPGYGMALAKAQQEVAALVKKMTAMGKEVKYAIHPVAGRMPGHMNVLLAEVGVDYDMLVEMETINPDFPSTDLSLVIGACDVVNPAAIHVEGTPISGMPILMAHEAINVICCNFDQKPGYSGVENPLYDMDHTVMLAGDAKKTVQDLLTALTEERRAETTDGEPVPAGDAAGAAALAAAKSVVIIPGYGMALARAQFKIAELAALLTRRGVRVKYAIHPVAGRMPGHMNVILAEAEVDYDDLLEMDEANPLFANTDVALIVGACDVVNPAAVEQEGTPISGMPILNAHEARKIIVCNFDQQPGYSGVPNPLYENKKTLLLLGDAKSTAIDLIASLLNLPHSCPK